MWRDYRSLHEFVYRSAHQLLRRRPVLGSTRQPSTALWWVPDGGRPDVGHALARLRFLQDQGPPAAFSLLRQFTVDGRPLRRGR